MEGPSCCWAGTSFSLGRGVCEDAKFMGAGTQRPDVSKEQAKPLRGSAEQPQSLGALLGWSFYSDQETGRGLRPAHSGAEQLLRRHQFL